MKKLTTPSGSYGPFAEVIVLPDSYHADGCSMPFTIYGEGGVVEDWVGPLPSPPKSPEELQAEITQYTQQRLDDFARTRGYDGILSACTYATSPTDKFQMEGQYCVISRDSTWAKLYQILGEVQAGTRPIPSGYADIEPELPPLVWPN